MKTLKRYQYERYAVLCRLAYLRVFKHTNYGFSPSGQRIVKNAKGRTLMRILWHDDHSEVIVVIKGSHSFSDWLINFACWQRSCTKTLGLEYSIHAGFYYLLHQESTPAHSLDKLGSNVIERLEAILIPHIINDKKITVTGHSSGGAISLVLADYFEHKYPNSIKRVVTFGQPAVGGWSFRQRYLLPKKTFRICCDIDIVTFLPPLPFLYWHTGRMLWLYNGKIHENTSTLIRFVLSLFSWVFRPFSYHLMSKYIRNKDFFDDR